MKFTDIFTMAASNMLRSKVRTLLTILAIFIGSFTITLTVGLSSGVSAYIDKQVNSVGAKNVLIIRPKVDIQIGSGPKKYNPNQKNTSVQATLANAMLNDKDIGKIKTQSGLTNFRAIVAVAPDYISGSNGEKYQINTQPFIDGSKFEVVSGSLIDNHISQYELLLPEAYIKLLGYSSSDQAIGKIVTIAIKNPTSKQEIVLARISGVQQESLLTQGGAFVNKPLSDRLAAIQYQGLPVEIAHRYIAATAQFDINANKNSIQIIKDGLSKKGYMSRTIDDQIGIVKQVIDAITAVLIFFGAIALLAASVGIINTLFMSVQERTKEIGLMKAMGMGQSKVFLLFSVEAVLIGFWGSLFGTIAAISVGQVANRVASDGFLKDLPGFSLTLFPIMSVALIIATVMLIAFLSGTLPSRRAATQDPIDALRYE